MNEVFKTLDNSPRVLFWRLDDFIVFTSTFWLGMLFGNIWLMLGGFILKWVYGKIKKQLQHLNVWALLYWNFQIGWNCFPPSYKRRLRN